MKVKILGSGTSHGIPVIGCNCPVCTSNDSRDKRMRASVFIEGPGGESVLIDAGPEFRLQALRAGINRLDAIFLTHAHADHIHGLDDIRPLCRDKPIPIFGNEPTIGEMEERFAYIWKDTQPGGGKPKLTPHSIAVPFLEGAVQIGALTCIPIPVKHGCLDILGWEVLEAAGSENIKNPAKSFLYLTDTSAIPPASLEWLINGNINQSERVWDKGLLRRVIVIGGLRRQPHETHFSFEQALDNASRLGAVEIYLTHICHSHSHAEIEEFCINFRENQGLKGTEIHPAQDGQEIIV